MEKGNRVQEIRRRFEGLNSQDSDSYLVSQRQLSSDQVSIIPRTVKKPSELITQSCIKGGIKRSHAFRSDKSKVKPFCGNSTPIDSSDVGDEKTVTNTDTPSDGRSLQCQYKLVSSNILGPPKASSLKHFPSDSANIKGRLKVEPLSDTLKKALKNPLPPGPAPKKPPRTFAHAKSFELEDSTSKHKFVHTLSKFENPTSNENNIPHKNIIALSQRSKTEPHIMLKKLEAALLSNQANLNNNVNTKREYPTTTVGSNKSDGSTSVNKTSSVGAKTFCLNGFSSCINRNIYDTPFEYKSTLGQNNLTKLTTLPPKGCAYGRIQKKEDSSHIYEEPYSPRSERKFNTVNSDQSSKTPSPKQSVHYMSSPVREQRRIAFQDVIITVSPARNTDDKIKMITDAFNDNTRSDSDADSIQEEKTGNHEEVTAARKVYAQRVSSMRRQTSYIVKRDNLFETLLLVGIDQDLNLGKVPYIKTKYPDTAEVAHGLECLVFPDASDWPPPESDCLSRHHNNYTLPLTNDSGRKYAYCRRLQPEGTPFCLPLAYVIITPHKDNIFFYSILAELEMRHGIPESDYLKFADSLYHSSFPKPGFNLNLGDLLIRRAADARKESYDISTLLRRSTVPVFIKVFSTLLHERKVILIGSNISVLSDCIEGLQKALFPFEWEHILVGAVPTSLLVLCEAPTPFLIGVVRPKHHPQLATFLPSNVLDNCLVADVESGEVLVSYGDEGTILPSRLSSCLKSALYLCPVHSSDTGPSEALIRLFVELVGHYNNHVVTNVHTNNRTFQKEDFVKAPKSRSIQQFLEWFTETGMFQFFIQRRLDRSFEPGLFEQRCAEYIEENVKVHNISKKEKSLNKTVKIIGMIFKFGTKRYPKPSSSEKKVEELELSVASDRFKDWTSSS